MEANVAYLLDDTFIRIFTYLVSKSWVKKCCADGYTVSLSNNECLLKDEKEPSRIGLVLKFLFNGIRNLLLPSTPLQVEKISAAYSGQFWSNGTSCVENSTNVVCFQPEQYCFNFVMEQNQTMLLNGTRPGEECSWMKLAWEGLKHFIFLFSLLLALVTLALYLWLPALRRRVYDKCLICYLSTVTVTVITVCILMICKIMKEINRRVYYNTFRLFLYLSVLFWLNVICFHLWRSVRSMNRKKIRFVHYAIYAWGCSLVVSGVEIIRYHFDIPILREPAGKWYDYTKITSIIVLFINLCLFLHVAFIIWQQKNQWKRNSDCRRHIKKQRRRMWQILKLFLIMGLLEWNNFFNCAYKLGISSKVYMCITKFLHMCPGYIIFIVFVYSNKKVISELKKRATVAHSKNPPAKSVKHPDVGYEARRINSGAYLLESDWVFHYQHETPSFHETSFDTFSRFDNMKTA